MMAVVAAVMAELAVVGMALGVARVVTVMTEVVEEENEHKE